MSMTKKHFIALAEIISKIPDCDTRWVVGEGIADLCRDDNPYFDTNKFYTAAGMDKCAAELGKRLEQRYGS